MPEPGASGQPERDKLQRACITLGWVVEGQARAIRAAWIDISKGDLEGAAQWVLNSIPDVDDDEPEDQWNGTETSREWFDRTRPEPLAGRIDQAAIAAQPQPAPDDHAAYELVEIRSHSLRHPAVLAVLRWFEYRHLQGKPREVSRVCAELALTILDAIGTDDPELTRGLSDLVTVKDHLVRAAIVDAEATAS